MQIRRFFKTLLTGAFALFMGLMLASAVQAQDAPRLLGKLHAAEGVGCVKCHGNAKKSEPVLMSTCLSCHGGGDSKVLAAKTAKVKPMNPHENRHYGTEAECGLCHRQHEKSVNFCLDCHNRFDFKVK